MPFHIRNPRNNGYILLGVSKYWFMGSAKLLKVVREIELNISVVALILSR